MELEVKHLKHYLGHKLRILRPDNRTSLELVGIVGNLYVFNDDYCRESYGEIKSKLNKPILHRLSSINKPIEVNGKAVVVLDLIRDTNHSFYFSAGYICEKCSDYSLQHQGYGTYPYWLIEILAEHHIDFQGLIPAGLAIDINTLKQ